MSRSRWITSSPRACNCPPNTIGFTGHRPGKLGDVPLLDGKLWALAAEYLSHEKPERIIIGMAPGWDLAAGEAAYSLGIKVVAAVPFKGFEERMSTQDRERFTKLLDNAVEVKYVSDPGRDPEKLFRRNRWIVVNSDRICALWNGSNSGTSNCVRYAYKVGKPVDNLWDSWKSLTKELK